MIFVGLIVCMVICALVPACLFFINVRNFRGPVAAAKPESAPHVAVLIPARNEAGNIGDALRCVLASRSAVVEVLVYDDASTDNTARIVREVAGHDNRVRLLDGVQLPAGWNGKQHACWQLAQASVSPLLLFLDADVRLGPEAIVRCVAQQQASCVTLMSGFPRIIMKTWMEWLVLPLVQWVLLGLLPMWRMRSTTAPAYAAGCGQFMLAEREAYFACGGHAAIHETRHDGLRLPKLFRGHGMRTDICDLTEFASVRMYSSATGVWNGLAKNATEGLGSAGKIVPLTLFLLMGQVVPALLFAWIVGVIAIWIPMIYWHGMFIVGVSSLWKLCSLCSLLLMTLLASFLPRFVAATRFEQPLRSALLHPVGIVVLLVIQWYALVRHMLGKPIGWRARKYPQ